QRLAGHDLVNLGLRRFALEVVNLAFQFALLFQNPCQGSSEFQSRRFQHLRKCVDKTLIFFKPHIGTKSRKSFNSSHTCSNSRLADNLEKAHIPGQPCMRSAAEFLTDVGDRDYANLLSIAFAEKYDRAACDPVTNLHDLC